MEDAVEVNIPDDKKPARVAGGARHEAAHHRRGAGISPRTEGDREGEQPAELGDEGDEVGELELREKALARHDEFHAPSEHKELPPKHDRPVQSQPHMIQQPRRHY